LSSIASSYICTSFHRYALCLYVIGYSRGIMGVNGGLQPLFHF
jgi:hypothetical protein